MTFLAIQMAEASDTSGGGDGRGIDMDRPVGAWHREDSTEVEGHVWLHTAICSGPTWQVVDLLHTGLSRTSCSWSRIKRPYPKLKCRLERSAGHSLDIAAG